ncbi:MAG: 3-oxoadipate enol-lactonase [Acidobacteriaceae bacterium]|nr:3-oxoadipate enol-lactonase [Acidobacteriaceae bacterium]
MPFADLNHCRLHYQLDGPSNAPLLVLSNSLGTDVSLWDRQMPAFTRSYRVVRYDTRGHGQSSLSSEPTTITSLASDVIALVDQVGADRFSFCGISIGGLTGMMLALSHPQRLLSLVLANTAARIGTSESWNARIDTVQTQGIVSLLETIMERWFTAEFRSKHNGIIDHFRECLANTSPEGYIQSCAALRDADLRQSVSRIPVRTLVIAGSHDFATTVDDARFIVEKIPGAAYDELPTAHISNVEAPEEFSRAVLDFLARQELFAKGMKQRRAVLGDTHIDRSLAQPSEFNREFQDLITRYAWGEIWNRPGLPRHTRSLLTLAMLVALNRGEEFRMHVRAAFNNGVTRDEIKEVLLQAAIYCGVPAANAAFHAAQEVFAAMEQGVAQTEE